jgi:hypothetical protein
MSFRPEEVSAVLAQELERYEAKLETKSVGTVLTVGDGIARLWGLEDAMAGELLRFPGDIMGMVLNLEEDNVGAVLFGSDKNIREGDRVERTNRIASVPVGKAMIGRVVNAIGQPVDGKGPIGSDHFRNVEFTAPSVVERQPVKEPLQTGIKAIDAMIPIGRGQRELIIGDRQTGKTAIALDAIINQKGQNVVCVYVAIGQKESTVANVVSDAREVRRDGVHDRGDRLGLGVGAAPVHRALRRARDGRGVHLQGRPRAVRVRRSLEARAGLPPALAAAAPSAGPRGVPRRRVLPPLAPARARMQAVGRTRAAARSPRCRSSRPRPATSRPTSRPT